MKYKNAQLILPDALVKRATKLCSRRIYLCSCRTGAAKSVGGKFPVTGKN